MTQTLIPDKRLAAVCGLFCGACSLFIGTEEEPERLIKIARAWKVPVDQIKCQGCRADVRNSYCDQCKMSSCSKEKGLDFCIQCEEYPCEELTKFQAARPHRIELWPNLARIMEAGHEKWQTEMVQHYSCPECDTINSAYDQKCRKCGNKPSCEYVRLHQEQIKRALA